MKQPVIECTVIPHLRIYTKDESKRGTVFAFIFGVNLLWRCGVTASFGVFFHEMKRNGMTSIMKCYRMTPKRYAGIVSSVSKMALDTRLILDFMVVLFPCNC